MSNQSQTDQDSNHDPSFYEHCAHCEDSLTSGKWHPVVSDSHDGTVVALYSFCDDECRAAWDDEQ